MQKLSKPLLLILLIAVALSFGGGMQYGRYRQSREQAATNLLTVIEEAAPPLFELPIMAELAPAAPLPDLAVHVKGAVAYPGLYKLPPGSRVADAIDKAILLEEANTDIINLASMVSDGAEVVVPFRIEDEPIDWAAIAQNAVLYTPTVNNPAPASASTPAAASSTAAFGIIDINRAGATELQGLSGIGPVKAQAIIDYRTQHGPFAKIDDIKKVSGIGPATYEKIKDRITVD
jgi:competence protein ComEA